MVGFDFHEKPLSSFHLPYSGGGGGGGFIVNPAQQTSGLWWRFQSTYSKNFVKV